MYIYIYYKTIQITYNTYGYRHTCLHNNKHKHIHKYVTKNKNSSKIYTYFFIYIS